MRGVVLSALIAALFVAFCGCPQTGGPTQATTDKLLEKFKEEGKIVTILYFGLGSSDPKIIRLRESLKGIENVSDGTVKFVAVDGRADRESKESYGIRTYPTILFFSEDGKLIARYGPDLTIEDAREIVKEQGSNIKSAEVDEGPPPESPPDEGDSGEDTPEEGDESEEGGSGGGD